MRHRLITVVLCAALTMVLGGSVSLTALAVSPPNGGVQTWAPENSASTHRVTATTAIEAARSFNLITPLKGTYRKHVAKMKQANPNLTLLAYMNGPLAQSNEATTFPDEWYLRDATGAKVTSLSWGNFLMNPANPGWISNRIQQAKSYISYSGYDGVIMDVMGTAPIGEGYASGVPINPATGQAWTKAQWLQATSALAARVKSAVAPKKVFVNGLGSGSRYFEPSAPSSQLLAAIDGAHAEAWLRNANEPITSYPTLDSWKKDVDMLADASSRGKSVLTLTKVWAAVSTQAQKESWHRFALASFLLGATDLSFFSFSYHRDDDPTAPHPLWLTQVGTSLGSYYALSNGAYRRDFVNGASVVNPTDAAVTISLGGSYRTLVGTQVTELTLGPKEGQVLIRQ